MTEGPGSGEPPGYGQPGYGPYGGYGYGYGRPPSPKPGIIPLRPLSVSEILDGAFAAMRWNPKATLVPSAIVAAVSGVLIAVVGFYVQRGVSASTTPQGQVTGQAPPIANATVVLLGVTVIISFFANMVLTGVLTAVIGQGVLGRKETAAGAWRATRSRVGPLIAAVLLAGLILFIGWAVAVTLSVVIAVAIAAGAHLVPVGVLVGVVGGLAATVFAVMTGIRWSLTTPIVVLERAGPWASLRRSWRLVRRSAWRVFGILLLTELIIGAAGLLLRLPFSILGGVSSFANPTASGTVTGAIVTAVGAVIAGTVTTPVLAGVIVLLYTDLRMRREGMDIALQAAIPGPGAPPPYAPPNTPPPGTGGQVQRPW
jgi:hypothetical protein